MSYNLKKKERKEFQLRKLELELSVKIDQTPVQVSSVEPVLAAPVFVYKTIRLVPPFLEKEVEKYFQHFERVAESLNWPKEFWTLLLQCVLVGRAQEVYSALSTEQSADYEIVKSAILHAYELAPEAYRQKFRNHFKSEKCTYLEFAREKENLFDHWCSFVKITTKEQLRELILLEEFKSCVPSAVAMHLNEHKVTKLSDAALMADEFVLPHQRYVHLNELSRSKLSVSVKNKMMVACQNVVSASADSTSVTRPKGEIVCFYCRKPGHKISDCAVLKKKDKAVKPVGLISTSSVNFIPDKQVDITEMENVKNSVDVGLFLTDGSVSLPDCDETVPVRILRDTGQGSPFCWKDFCLCLNVLPLDLMCWSEGLKWATWKFLYTTFTLIPSLCQVM